MIRASARNDVSSGLQELGRRPVWTRFGFVGAYDFRIGSVHRIISIKRSNRGIWINEHKMRELQHFPLIRN